MRVIIRSEIGEALAALRHVESSNFTARKSIRVLEALMAEEEERWNSSGGDSGSAYTSDSGVKRKRGELAGEPRKSLLSLALRVARATQCGEAPADEKSQPRDCGENDSDDIKVDGEPNNQDTKNAVSAKMMNHLVNPANQQSSDSFNWPQVDLGSEFDRGRVAPNGLEPIATSDGQQFDLNAFLAQCENSPSSNSDDHSKNTPEASSSCSSSLPSLERGTSTASSSSNNNDSRHASFSDLPQNSGAEGQELDKFWSWILSQGGNEAGQQPQSQVQMAAPGSNNNNNNSMVSNNNIASSFTSAPILGGGGTLSLQRAPSFAQSPNIGGQIQEKTVGGDTTAATPSAGVDWLSGPSFFDFTSELGNLDQQQPAPTDAW